MPATMSLLGLYNWDSSVLDKLQLPASVDRSVFINNLLITCAELEILYPQPETLKFAVGAWSAERLPVWNRLEATTQYEYNPITNYDRTEEWEEDQQYDSDDEISEDRTIERTASGSSAGTLSDTSESSGSSSGEQTRTEAIDRKTAGFNSSTSNVPDGQEDRDITENSTGSNNSSTTRAGENSGTYQDSDKSEISGNTARSVSDKRTNKRRGRAFGNIGVTTTQQMIREERDVVMFDLAEVIIGEFKNTFCLLIY